MDGAWGEESVTTSSIYLSTGYAIYSQRMGRIETPQGSSDTFFILLIVFFFFYCCSFLLSLSSCWEYSKEYFLSDRERKEGSKGRDQNESDRRRVLRPGRRRRRNVQECLHACTLCVLFLDHHNQEEEVPEDEEVVCCGWLVVERPL